MASMTISIIIPTFNEASSIGPLIHFLKTNSDHRVKEILVVDGGSTDETVSIAAGAGAHVLQGPQKGRAWQMNYGALQALGEVLYFVHADTFPASSFVGDIVDAISEGCDLGRYRTRFLSRKWLLRINEWFTRFDLFIGMGGDQTLFVKKALFEKLNGFDESMALMEDFEFCQRARKEGRYKIMRGAALISARKYDKNSWLAVQLANYKVVSLYKQGASQHLMVEVYRKRLKW